MSSYCRFARDHPIHASYHDREYGFPERDDRALFERLVLEINQAGLSWELMLRKRENFRRAFEGFDPVRVAAYGDGERERLLADAGIIRNRLKIGAVIHNAGVIVALSRQYGGLASWIDLHHPLGRPDWVKLFKGHFRFTGGEIVNEFLMSTGWLPGAHEPDCPVYAEVLRLQPPWLRAATKPTDGSPATP